VDLTEAVAIGGLPASQGSGQAYDEHAQEGKCRDTGPARAGGKEQGDARDKLGRGKYNGHGAREAVRHVELHERAPRTRAVEELGNSRDPEDGGQSESREYQDVVHGSKCTRRARWLTAARVLPVPDESASVRSLTVQAFGVRLEVTAPAHHLGAVTELLPPGALPADGPPQNGRFTLVAVDADGLMDVVCDGQSLIGIPADPRVALGVLDAQMRMHIALHAPDHVFVHAGVVGSGDKALVIPGHSFVGKTTLVAALVRAGAEYWSDEYAVLDAEGLVHPYAKPLSVRTGYVSEDRTIESLGGRAGDRALEVRLIAVTQYRAGRAWAPRPCSAGEGAIKLLEHTIPARSRPEQALTAVRRAAAQAIVLEGDRGEADVTAAALLAVLEANG
jgi:hypothetical protein